MKRDDACIWYIVAEQSTRLVLGTLVRRAPNQGLNLHAECELNREKARHHQSPAPQPSKLSKVPYAYVILIRSTRLSIRAISYLSTSNRKWQMSMPIQRAVQWEETLLTSA